MFQKNVKIRQLQEGIKDAMHQLHVIYTNYKDMAPLVKRYMSEYGLELRPARLTPSTSSESVLSISSREEAGGPSVEVNVAQVNLTFSVKPQEDRRRGVAKKPFRGVRK